MMASNNEYNTKCGTAGREPRNNALQDELKYIDYLVRICILEFLNYDYYYYYYIAYSY